MEERKLKYPGTENFTCRKCGPENEGIGKAIILSCLEGALVRPFERVPFIKSYLVKEGFLAIVDLLESALIGEITNKDLVSELTKSLNREFSAAGKKLFTLNDSEFFGNSLDLNLISNMLNIEIRIYNTNERAFSKTYNRCIYMNPPVVHVLVRDQRSAFRMRNIHRPYQEIAEIQDVSKEETANVLLTIGSILFDVSDEKIKSDEVLNELLEDLRNCDKSDLFRALHNKQNHDL